MSEAATEIRIAISYSDGNGKTCVLCLHYRAPSEFVPDHGRYDDLSEICRDCIRANAGKPVIWHAELMGLGDNDGAWTYWERKVKDAEELRQKLHDRTRELKVLEENRTDWSFYVRWAGRLSVNGRMPRDEHYYLLSAWRIPPAELAVQ